MQALHTLGIAHVMLTIGDGGDGIIKPLLRRWCEQAVRV
jgi:hypothetical protein